MFDNIKPIDPVAERRLRYLITGLAFTVMLAGYLYYELKNYPEEQQVKRFFVALQQQDYQGAYRIWKPTSAYSFKDFSQDWGRERPEGAVSQFHVTGSSERGSGVIVRVMVNNKDGVSIWVEKKSKSLSFPP